jgi:uncharacterized OsmC-like protein
MASIITGEYTGDKQVRVIHQLSGKSMMTDAPPDNQGKGRDFSPTDLVAAALGSCVMTIISIVAERDGIDIQGMTMRVEKHMSTEPRRIGEMPLEIHLPKSLEDSQRQTLENAARACPVHKSLHPDIKAEIVFTYDL